MSPVSESLAGCAESLHQGLHLFDRWRVGRRRFPLRPGLGPHLLKRQDRLIVEPAHGRDLFEREATFLSDRGSSLFPVRAATEYSRQLIASPVDGERSRAASLRPQSLVPLPDGFVDRL